jgi:cytoskeletal protein CcmA (bactofilin family)
MSLWKPTRGPSGEEPTKVEALTPASAPPLEASAHPPRRREEGAEMANIGKSITIKGDVTGDEDLVIEGNVEGRIELKNHHLTIGSNGHVKAEISAKQVTIVGRVAGNVVASERAEISETGTLDGDLIAPRLLVQEGAQLNGAITMKGGTAAATPQERPKLEPAPPPPVSQKAG